MIDFLTLVKRDHHDIEAALDELLRAETVAEVRSALDCVRLGLTAHAEAEDIVLYRALQEAPHRDQLEGLVAQAHAAHLAQEGVLASLVCASPGTKRWRDRGHELRELVRDHGSYEEIHIIPAIRELAPSAYAMLAGEFATERMRQLAMLQPSAPIFIPELAQAS